MKDAMKDERGASDINVNVVLDHDFPPLPFREPEVRAYPSHP